MKRPVNVIIDLLGSVDCSINELECEMRNAQRDHDILGQHLIDIESALRHKKLKREELQKELQESVHSMMTEEVSDA